MKALIPVILLVTSPTMASLFETQQPFTADFLGGAQTSISSRSIFIDGDEIACEPLNDKVSAWILKSNSLKSNFLINVKGEWKLGLTPDQVSDYKKQVADYQPDATFLNDRLKEFQAKLERSANHKTHFINLATEVNDNGTSQNIDKLVSDERKSIIESQRESFALTRMLQLQKEVGNKLATDPGFSAYLSTIPDPKITDPKTHELKGFVKVSKVEQDPGICPTLAFVANTPTEYPKIQFKTEFGDDFKGRKTLTMRATLSNEPNVRLGTLTQSYTPGLTKSLGGVEQPNPIVNLSLLPSINEKTNPAPNSPHKLK